MNRSKRRASAPFRWICRRWHDALSYPQARKETEPLGRELVNETIFPNCMILVGVANILGLV
jgi:hypothetical protein